MSKSCNAGSTPGHEPSRLANSTAKPKPNCNRCVTTPASLHPDAPHARQDRSYRALLRVPTLGRVLVSMILARIAQSMVGVAMVLFTLREYGSPALAGAVTLAYVLPGLVVSPIAGALLDRHGRVRLIILDY